MGKGNISRILRQSPVPRELPFLAGGGVLVMHFVMGMDGIRQDGSSSSWGINCFRNG